MISDHSVIRPASRQDSARRGVVLIVVLVIVALLSVSAFTYSQLMLVEHRAVILHGEAGQARGLADSGVAMLRYYLSQDPLTREGMGGHYDNYQQFQAILVRDDADFEALRGRFSIVSPSWDTNNVSMLPLRFGLEDCSSRININLLADKEFLEKLEAIAAATAIASAVEGESEEAGDGASEDTASTSGGADSEGSSEQAFSDSPARTLLMALPAMTEDVADAIIDWIDRDDEPSDFGAETEYYSTLDPPYAAANGPLKTVEELLLVRGVTPELLFGLDANRNGVVDNHERNGDAALRIAELGISLDSFGGDLDRGWAAYLTLHSKETNEDFAGEARISLDTSDLETLYEDLLTVLDAESADYIIAYLLSEPPEADNAGGANGEDGGGATGEDGGGATGGGGNPAQLFELRPGGGGNDGGGRGDGASVDSAIAPLALAFSQFRLSSLPLALSTLQVRDDGGGDRGGDRAGGGGGDRGGDRAGGRGGRGGRRRGGRGGGGGGGGGGSGNTPPPPEPELADIEKLDLTKSPTHKLEHILDLVDAEISIKFDGDEQATPIICPFKEEDGSAAEYVPMLLEHLTISKEETFTGRININEAPAAILSAIPGMDEEMIDGILAMRESQRLSESPYDKNVGWLVAQGIMDVPALKQLTPIITGGGDVFQAQVVGYFDGGGRSSRLEVIIDATELPARVVSWRDLSHLGRGFALDVLGVQSGDATGAQ